MFQMKVIVTQVTEYNSSGPHPYSVTFCRTNEQPRAFPTFIRTNDFTIDVDAAAAALFPVGSEHMLTIDPEEKE